MSADLEQIRSDIGDIIDIEELILHELRKTRKASCEAHQRGNENEACGLAYVAAWLVAFASDCNINLKDDD